MAAAISIEKGTSDELRGKEGQECRHREGE
jgi:hypothetical protein